MTDVGPLSKEIDAGLPHGSSRDQVLKWFDEKRCSYKFGRNSDPLVPLCKNPRPCEKNFKIHIDFDDQGRFVGKGVFPDE